MRAGYGQCRVDTRWPVLSGEHSRSGLLERDALEVGPRVAWDLEEEQVYTPEGIIARRRNGA